MRRLQRLWGVLVLLLLYTGFQLGRLIPSAPAAWVWGATVAVFWLLIGWQAVYRSRRDAAEAPWFPAVAWTGAVATGLWATFLLFSLAVDAARLARWAATGATGPALAGVTAALALSVSALGLRAALAGPRVVRVTVRVPDLAPGLEGLRIAHLSDLHVGPTIRRGYVERIAAATVALDPELVALTGDMADGSPEALAPHLEPLANLRAPLGVFYVTGNHEYYWDAAGWVARARDFGWTALVNEHRILTRGGASLLVGGVPDPVGPHFLAAHAPDLARAAGNGAADFKLLLAHRPDAYAGAEKAGFDLQLSGHTHGGQFFPFSLIVRLAHRYLRGLHRVGRLWLYVNSGTGYWGPPHRFGVPAEIALITLTGLVQ